MKTLSRSFVGVMLTVAALGIVADLTPPGYYSATGTGPGTPASPGYYVPIAGSTSQTPAAPGYFVSITAATSAQPAPLGKYATGPAATQAVNAPVGYFVAQPAQSAPTPAPAGSYVDTEGQTSATLAGLGHYVPEPASTGQVAAAPGYFVDVLGATAPIAAPPGYFVSVAAAAIAQPAPLGKYAAGPAATVAVNAPLGYFVAQPAQSAPTPAPAGSYVNAVGQTTSQLADPGYYVPEAASATQTAAAPGYFVDVAGATAPKPAPPGSFVSGTAATSATPAPAGKYAAGPAATEAVDAPLGYYVATPGAAAPTPAPVGTYVDAVGQTFAKFATAGHYVPTEGAASQTPAQPGYFVDVAGASSQTPAPPGRFVSGFAATVATLAPAGKYAVGPAATEAVNAPLGHYVAFAGASAPVPASPGTYVPAEGRTSAQTAQPGYYVSTTAASAQVAASRGYYVATSGASAQIPSPAGKYVPTMASTFALNNPPGTWSHEASVATRAITATVNHTNIVGPVFSSNHGTGGTINIGNVSAQQIVNLQITNTSADLGFADPLTDLGIVDVQIGGDEPGLVEVDSPAATTLHEGQSSVLGLVVYPGRPGTHSATVTIVTDEGAEPGNAGPVEHVFTITFETPVSAIQHKTGDPVPGAGLDPRIAAGSVFVSFGVPAVNDRGVISYLARWAVPTRPAKSGMFVGDFLVAQVGEAVPGLPGVKFVSFKDPVAGESTYATSVMLGGTGVTAANDSAIAATDTRGGLTIVAREGDAAPDTGGALFATFPTISAAPGAAQNGGELMFKATLKVGTGSPVVSSANDLGVWVVDAFSPPHLTARETSSVISGIAPISGVTEIKSLQFLTANGGSPAAGGQYVNGNVAGMKAVLADNRQVLIDGYATTFAVSGGGLAGATLPGALWKTFASVQVGSFSNGEGFTNTAATRAVLQTGVGVTTSNNAGIFLSSDSWQTWEPVARVSGLAPGASGATFAGFKDPVLAVDKAAVAFPATLRGVGVTSASNDTLWYLPAAGNLGLLAREGTAAPGGGVWKAFSSLALPGGAGGPIFRATLTQGVDGITSATDVGVWGVNSSGNLQLLFREGDVFDGKTVKVFNVLNAVMGSNGASRAFNSQGEIVWLATFTDNSTAIIRSSIP